MRPRDILPDHVNEIAIDGTTVRKGSVGAFLANARVIMDDTSTADARREAESHIAELMPALGALGLFEVFDLRDPRLRTLLASRWSAGDRASSAWTTVSR